MNYDYGEPPCVSFGIRYSQRIRNRQAYERALTAMYNLEADGKMHLSVLKTTDRDLDAYRQWQQDRDAAQRVDNSPFWPNAFTDLRPPLPEQQEDY